MLKQIVATFFASTLFMAPAVALNVGDIATDGKGHAYLVVAANDKGDFVKPIRLRALAKVDASIFNMQHNGQAAVFTVGNHAPFVGPDESRLEMGLRRAALVRGTQQKCLRMVTVIQVVEMGTEAPAPAVQEATGGALPSVVQECMETLVQPAEEL